MSKITTAAQEERYEEYVKANPIAALWELAVESTKRHPSSNVHVQLIRSLVVSVIALAMDFIVLLVLKEKAGLNYLLAATISFLAGTATNYILSNTWVFAEHKFDSAHKEFLIFLVICAIGLLFNLGVIAGMVQVLKADYRLAKVVAAVVVFFWNFIARKKVLY